MSRLTNEEQVMGECQVCERSAATGWTGGPAHCHTCHRSWTSRAEAHCTVCHQQFSSNSAADKHWVGEGRGSHSRHVDPATVASLAQRPTGVWTEPMDPERLQAFTRETA